MMKFTSNSGNSIKNLSSNFRDAAPTNASASTPPMMPSSSSWVGNNNSSNSNNDNNNHNHADPGILEFGTSVTVHDEMRRAIGMEIQEIEASLTKYTNEIATEQKIRQELVKTQAAAHQELCHLRRGAIEAVERLEVNETVFMKLQQDNDGTFMDTTSNEWQTRMKEHGLQMERLKQDIQTYAEQFEHMRQQKQETIAAAECILDRIQREQLEEKAATARERNTQAKQELRYQQEKLQSLREQNHATQTRLEEWEQRLQIMEEKNQDDKIAHETKEREWQAKIAHLQDTVRSKLQKQTDAEAELERLEKNIQQLKDAYQTAMDLLAERVTLQATIQSKRTERNALLTQKQALEKEIGSIQDATSVLRATALEEEINKSQALVKRKEKNDQYEKEEIEAARNEIQKMEAQLAQWDEKGDDELLDLTEKNMIIQQIHQLERTLIELQEESCKATQEIQSKQASLEKAKEQLQQLQDQRSAQTMELEQIKTECATALETNREELRQQRQREFDELERKAAICRFAKTAMEKTESRIAKYASGKYDQELFSEEKDK